MIDESSHNMRIGSAEFCLRSGVIQTRTSEVRLEPLPASILHELVAADGEILSRDELLDKCWKSGDGSDEALTQAIAQIRRALRSVEILGVELRTAPKRGYSLLYDAVRDEAKPRSQRMPNLRGRMIIYAAVLALVFAFLVAILGHRISHGIQHALFGNSGL